MTDALIGHTGFVGGNLARQRHFDEFYNSQNIEDIRGREFDLVICAGAPGTKWVANENPEEDWAKIVRLAQAIPFIKARHFVLISTVDVLGCKDAYGSHRATVEQVVRTYHTRATIVRLPTLFGPGLRKNALYDLMRGRRLDEIAPNATYQWFPLDFLDDMDWPDVCAQAPIHQWGSVPITMEEIRAEFFPDAVIGSPRDDAAAYDVPMTVEIPRSDLFAAMRYFLRQERADA